MASASCRSYALHSWLVQVTERSAKNPPVGVRHPWGSLVKMVIAVELYLHMRHIVLLVFLLLNIFLIKN